jgi:hypothetical protein
MYQGKTLTEWLFYEKPASEPSNSPNRQAEAVRQIGSNAVPFLLKWVQYRTPAWRNGLSAVLCRLPGNIRFEDKRRERTWAAWLGFQLLGPKGRTAIPELIRLMNDPNSSLLDRQQPIFALGYLGEEAFPPILAALSNPNHPDRAAAAFIIGSSRDLGTNRVRAVPVLLQCLADKDVVFAASAATALGRLEMEPSLVVPALTNSLGGSRKLVRRSAARALGHFAGQAQKAAPALVRALSDSDVKVRSEATHALSHIAPELPEQEETWRDTAGKFTYRAEVWFHP